jgi:hypothetical protein
MMPARIVGSGMGANLLECRLGSGVPFFLLSAIFTGSTAPTTNISAGIEATAAPHRQAIAKYINQEASMPGNKTKSSCFLAFEIQFPLFLLS